MGATVLYGHKEILVNLSPKATKKNGNGRLKVHVSDPGPSWPSCLTFRSIFSAFLCVFKGLVLQTLKNKGFFGKGLTLYQTTNF